MSETVTADEQRLRRILSENGMTTKLNVKLNYKEYQLHSVLCQNYNFTENVLELELPPHLLTKLTDNFHTIWLHKPVGSRNGKTVVLFKLTSTAVKLTLKTALAQDKGIFNSKVNPVVLHPSWAKYITLPTADTKKGAVDWSRAEQHAHRLNEHTKQQINDGKTFNAQKDNPWARKHLKNKNKNQ